MAALLHAKQRMLTKEMTAQSSQSSISKRELRSLPGFRFRVWADFYVFSSQDIIELWLRAS
jgi:hypothetical protein